MYIEYIAQVIEMFRGCNVDDMPPHIYSVAQTAYRDMLESRSDQSIVLRGWSGSGKSANLRQLLRFYSVAIGSVNKLVTRQSILSFLFSCGAV